MVAVIAVKESSVRRESGFTLIELLIASTLCLGLAAFLMSAVAAMQREQGVAADRAAMAERATQALEVIAYSNQLTKLAATVTATLDPCASPETNNADILPSAVIALPGRYICWPATDMPVDSPLLMIDAWLPCEPDCPSPSEPGFLRLDPGCHPLFEKTTPEIRWAAERRRPADCDVATGVAVLDRQLFYWRDYAWSPGDGIGAVMQKRLRPQLPAAWGRAEMLAAGVEAWSVTPMALTTGIAKGLEITITVRGWFRDRFETAGHPSLTLARALPGRVQWSP
jgi:prepilin-type N-terminal cleavage/methylation domain-containing protein